MVLFCAVCQCATGLHVEELPPEPDMCQRLQHWHHLGQQRPLAVLLLYGGAQVQLFCY